MKLIAEPWDVGPGGYQVGNFPVLWTEWNGKYRDCVRRFWKGDGGLASELATRFAGSSDLYQGDGRKPYASINFITCHDGFTLQDLVSYDHKHNEARAWPPLVTAAPAVRMGVRRLSVYLPGAALLWYTILLSGVHPTIAGVLAAAVIPLVRTSGEADAPELPLHRLEHALSPWVAFVIRFSTIPPCMRRGRCLKGTCPMRSLQALPKDGRGSLTFQGA